MSITLHGGIGTVFQLPWLGISVGLLVPLAVVIIAITVGGIPC